MWASIAAFVMDWDLQHEGNIGEAAAFGLSDPGGYLNGRANYGMDKWNCTY
jgi:hypothetical protein